MQKITGSLKLNYEWQKRVQSNENIPENHVYILHSFAEEEILSLSKKGHAGGNLTKNIDGVEYIGTWGATLDTGSINTH